MTGTHVWYTRLAIWLNSPDKEDSNGLQDDIDERKENGETTDVVEGCPGGGVFGWLGSPNASHSDDPQDVHYDSQYIQHNHLEKNSQYSINFNICHYIIHNRATQV